MLLPFLIFSFIAYIQAVSVVEDNLNFDLELIKHQPCAYGSKSKWTKKLEFESGNDKKGPKLEPVDGKSNCFAIGGKVEVLQDFPGDFSIYLELRNTAKKNQVPEACVKQGSDGCGGFGSCLYCNACKTFGDNLGVQAQLLLDGKPIKCTDGLPKGTYENLKLAFCLPRMEDILKSQGLTKEAFMQLINEDASSIRAMGVFATVYVFDKDVSQQMQTQNRIESVYKANRKGLFKDEPLPSDVYWSLPFNMMIKNQQAYVACHKIYGNIRVKNTNA
ncbi:unnamed protein product [Auanema sp. JU1783]|nr:unnamed protein product [Auanema sp. JU1783]